jgi:hypothetical protein
MLIKVEILQQCFRHFRNRDAEDVTRPFLYVQYNSSENIEMKSPGA